jgi:CubicO group peptidase (beta-lactamase class C family)
MILATFPRHSRTNLPHARIIDLISAMMAAALLLMTNPLMAASLGRSDIAAITSSVEQQIALGNIPGAVILIGSRETLIYRAALGYRTLDKAMEPMTVDTIFDLASLTKVVATTTAILQLSEAGVLDLDAPVSRYWPAFARVDGGLITIQDLLTHHSGLPADLNLDTPWNGYQTAMAMILTEHPSGRPGETYRYSDMNFEILGEIVHRVSGEPLERYCDRHIFGPLGMKNTMFLPPRTLESQIAPTAGVSNRIYRGEVHDATARRMGGVAGHAGLFSTADDLAIFSRMLLNAGTADGASILNPDSVKKMARRQSPPASPRARGLGWDIGGPGGAASFPADSFGHFGYTGTMLWIDPKDDLFAIVLTNRVYPHGLGDADPLRRAILGILRQASEGRH